MSTASIANPQTSYEKYPKLYGSKQWRHIRLSVLDRDLYLCQQCLRMGKETMLTTSSPVHHKKPHNGDRKLFFDMKNLEGVCKTCHDAIMQVQANHGFSQACDANGFPLDVNHWWSK